MRQTSKKPIYMSTVKTGKHMDPVWQVYWLPEEPAKNLTFCSVSSDGRVTMWTLAKNELQYTNIMELALNDETNDKGGQVLAGPHLQCWKKGGRVPQKRHKC